MVKWVKTFFFRNIHRMAKCSGLQVAHWFCFSLCGMFISIWLHWMQWLVAFFVRIWKIVKPSGWFSTFCSFTKYFHFKNKTKCVVIKDWNGFAINSGIRIKFWLNNNLCHFFGFFLFEKHSLLFLERCTNWKCCNLLNRQVKIIRKKRL